MGKVRSVLTAISLAAALGALGVPNASAATGYDRCVGGNFCFFSGYNGAGSICQSRYDESDTVAKCGAWVGNYNAKSAYNNSGRGPVNIYAGTNYTQRKGSVANQGNLQGSYQIRSFDW